MPVRCHALASWRAHVVRPVSADVAATAERPGVRASGRRVRGGSGFSSAAALLAASHDRLTKQPDAGRTALICGVRALPYRRVRCGYDWHNIIHMIARLLSDDLHTAVTEHREFDAADYARRLAQLPGDWPPPQAPDLP
jgi:hypothetical protein